MKSITSLICVLFALNIAASGQRSANDIEGSWSGVLNTPAGNLSLVLNFSLSEAEILEATLDSPDQGAFGIPCGKVNLNGDTIDVDVPAIQGSYSGVFSNDTLLSGAWKQGGLSFILNLKKGTNAVVYNRPQEPKPPFPYRVEEVKFINKAENFKLAGSLTLPEGEGPFAAVVLISGSGPQDRDESVFNHKPFWVLADHLSRKGIAVLRYDDRGVGGSEGVHENASSLNFADDAEAAFDYLMHHPLINKKKIGLAGHSEGGLIASIVAARNNKVAFVVSLAGPGINGRDLLLKQTGDIMRVSGAPQALIDETLATNEKVLDMAIEESDQELFANKAMEWYVSELDKKNPGEDERRAKISEFTQAINAVNNPWMRYFLKTDPAQFWSQVQCPVLAINGEKDTQVNHEANLNAIKRAVNRGGNQKIKIVALAGQNHIFQNCESGSPAEYIKIEETFSPVSLELISSWIRESMKIK